MHFLEEKNCYALTKSLFIRLLQITTRHIYTSTTAVTTTSGTSPSSRQTSSHTHTKMQSSIGVTSNSSVATARTIQSTSKHTSSRKVVTTEPKTAKPVKSDCNDNIHCFTSICAVHDKRKQNFR